MELEEQLPAAETNAELPSDEVNETSQETQTHEGETDTPTETDEQKNARALADEAEKSRRREEKKQASIQRRFDEMTREKYEQKARADYLEQQLKDLQSRSQPSQQDNAPTRDQFDSYEEFVEAKATYKAQQEAKRIVQESIEGFTKTQKQEQATSQYEQQRVEAERAFVERVNEVKKEYPDYQEVIEDAEFNLPNTVVDLIVKMPEGPKISYLLAKNPALQEQFKSAPEYMHGVLLGQMVASFKSPQKTVSSAPAPGKPVQSKAGSSSEPPSDPNAYRAWADKHFAKRT